MPIQYFERSHLSRPTGSVVRKLRPRQPFNLSVWLAPNKATKISFHPLINYFRLPIHLWMVNVLRLHIKTQNLLPKNAHEDASFSDTINEGSPCKRTTCLINNSATVKAVNGWRRVRKWAYFESRSTTKRMVSTPLEIGKPSIKSIIRSSHTKDGIHKGWRRPLGCRWKTFCC